jgi:ribosomal protein S18 acetylase RimI-like enzyme
VRAASWRAAYKDILPARTLTRLTATWDRKFPAGTWVIERDRLVVGYCITGVDSLARIPAVVALNELYVFPELWRTGLGSALLVRVLDELESRSVKEVVLDVLERNQRGIAFYEANGFRHVKSGDRVSNIDGEKFTVLQYRRTL